MKVKFSTDLGTMTEIDFYTEEACRKFLAILVNTNGQLPRDAWFRRYRNQMASLRLIDREGTVRKLVIDFHD